MQVTRYGYRNYRRKPKQFEHTCKCGCGSSVWQQGGFRGGHSVQKRRKALKRTHLPLGRDRRRRGKKKKKKAQVPVWGVY